MIVNIITDLELAIVNSDRDIRSATLLKRSLDVKGWIKPYISTPKKSRRSPQLSLLPRWAAAMFDEVSELVIRYVDGRGETFGGM